MNICCVQKIENKSFQTYKIISKNIYVRSGKFSMKKNQVPCWNYRKKCCDLSQAKLPLGMCNKKSSLFVIKFSEWNYKAFENGSL